MSDSVIEQIYREAEFMIDTCGETRQQCKRQQEQLAAQRERATRSREKQAEWGQKQAGEYERPPESLTRD